MSSIPLPFILGLPFLHLVHIKYSSSTFIVPTYSSPFIPFLNHHSLIPTTHDPNSSIIHSWSALFYTWFILSILVRSLAPHIYHHSFFSESSFSKPNNPWPQFLYHSFLVCPFLHLVSSILLVRSLAPHIHQHSFLS